MATPRRTRGKPNLMEPCPKCGQVHQRDGKPTCSGHRKAQYGGGPCMKFPVAGASVCRTHGAAAPQTLAKAKERVQLEQLARAVSKLGDVDPTSIVTPVQEMLDLVRESARNVAFYRELVGELPTHPEPPTIEWHTGKPHLTLGTTGIYGPTYHQSGIPTGEAKPNILVVMYNEERDRHRANVKAAIDAGIQERQVKLLEADAQRLFAGVGEAMRAAELTPTQVEAFRRALGSHLRRSEPAGLAR